MALSFQSMYVILFISSVRLYLFIGGILGKSQTKSCFSGPATKASPPPLELSGHIFFRFFRVSKKVHILDHSLNQTRTHTAQKFNIFFEEKRLSMFLQNMLDICPKNIFARKKIIDRPVVWSRVLIAIFAHFSFFFTRFSISLIYCFLIK